ncbi:dynein light chain tctex-type 3 [Limosa lapponica baueri]|uniref:Dynein light chain Tctex-type 3 n=1 Tax=Limosa lapponica baueri TaxID=1758121 RepID=A0A2I0U193_LIMLA|nr:dynein light chain tctex-type 3 [Limosa lapponica baueri]
MSISYSHIFLIFKAGCIESVLGKADYNHNKVNQWTAAIVEQSLTHLVKLGKTYKYIGSVNVIFCHQRQQELLTLKECKKVKLLSNQQVLPNS